MQTFWRLYFTVGLIASTLLEVSYVYAAVVACWHMGWNLVSVAGVVVLLTIGFSIAIEPIFRFVLWLPSLGYWAYASDESFWHWLAPGFFTSFGVSRGEV